MNKLIVFIISILFAGCLATTPPKDPFDVYDMDLHRYDRR
jgi:archaellum component FlaG (FlaF/FlaG flagellin family)